MAIIDPIILAMEQQVECYRLLVKLAEAQHAHVQQSEPDALLEVLRRRQEMLDRIEALEKTLAPARKQWAGYVEKLDAPRRAQAERLVAETRAMLERITESDRDDAMVLQQQKLSVGRQMTQTTTARQLNRNYAAACGPRKSTMDLQQ